MTKWHEPVLYQYRWTNPDGEKQPASMLEWKGVEPAWNQTVAQKCDELLAYRYKGEPPYEVRALVPESQLKQAVRDALNLAADTCESTLYVGGDGTVSVFGPKTDANVEIRKCRDAIRALIKEIPA